MTTTMSISRIDGQAWVQGQDGQLRALAVGDTVTQMDKLVTAPGTVVELMLADGRSVTLLGEQSYTLGEDGVATVSDGDQADPGQTPETPAPQPQSNNADLLSDGFGFVQLVRINEILEADGFTPLSLARIQEALKESGLRLLGVNGELLTDNGIDELFPDGTRPATDLSDDDGDADRFAPEQPDTPAGGGNQNQPPVVDSTLLDQQSQDDESITLDVSGGFSDPDSDDGLTYSANGLPPGLSIDPNTGVVSGTLDNSASQGGNDGVYSVTISVTDSDGSSVEQTFDWNVSNPPPTAQDDSSTTAQGAAPLVVDASNGVLSNDNDPDGDSLTVSEVNGTAGNLSSDVVGSNGGVFTLQPDGSYSFDGNGDFASLAAGETAQTSITYTVSDGEGGSDTATLTITVSGSNDAPVPVDDLADQSDLDADSVALVTATAFSDANLSDTLTYSAAGLPAGLSIDPSTGEITGTIDSSASQGGSNGVYNVTVTATDPAGASATQSFDWSVSNPAPTAKADAGTTEQGAVLTVGTNGVLANDHDPDGDTLTVVGVNGAAGNVANSVSGSGSGMGNGLFTVNADGSYSFDPNGEFDYLAAGESATSTINYTVSDGEGGTDTASITVTITGSNNQPIVVGALADQSDVDDQGNISVATSGVFADADISDSLSYSASALPPGLSINPNTGEITGTIDNSASQGGTGGVYNVTVTATDNAGATASQSFAWTVTNPAPTATADTGSTDEDTILSVTADGVLANDNDPDGDDLTVQSVDGVDGNVGNAVAGNGSGTGNGLFTVRADGSYDFDPNGEFDYLADGESETSTIEYTVSDGEGGTDTASITVTINGTNDAPTPVGTLADQADVDAQDNVSVATAGGFTDADLSNTLTYSAADLPAGLTIDPSTGEITGTIDNSASQDGTNGVYSVTVTATDDAGATATQTFDWTVTNPAPIAQDDNNATTENAAPLNVAATGGVLSNDSDPDADDLTVSEVNGVTGNVTAAVSGSNGGIFTLQSDGSYSFDGNGDFESLAAGETAQTSVQYTVSDGEGGTDTATLTVTVTGTNDQPIAVGTIPDQADLDADVVSVATSSAFDDADASNTLTYSATGLPTGLSIDSGTGEISGTIDNSASQGGTNGVYSITVTATDDAGTSATQTFDWTVNNPAPAATADTGSTDEDTVLTVAADGVLSNDSDPDGDVLAVSAVNGDSLNVNATMAGNGSGVGNGEFIVRADGSYSFDPNGEFDYLAAGESETSTISYTVSDGEGGTDTTSITVTINGANDAPTPVGTLADQADVDAQDNVSVATAAGFTDADLSNTLTYSADNLPAGLSIDTNSGEITGTIDNSASQGGTGGVYSVTVTATDDAGATATQAFDWTVTNPAPLASDDAGSTNEDTVLSVAADGVLANDNDPDGDDLTVQSVDGVDGNVGNPVAGNGSGTGNGLFTVNADGSYDFDPNGEFDYLAASESETSTINYTVSDGEGGTSTASITVTVNGANDAPTTVGTLADQADVDAQDNVSVATAGGFTDADLSDTITYSVSGLPAGLSFDPNTGEITGTIDSSASQGGTGGVYSVTVTATDNGGASATQTFDWTVTNPAPTATADTGSTDEDTILSVAADGVLANDNDPDGDTLTVQSVDGATGNVANAVAGNGSGTGNGLFTVNTDGSYDFDPNGEFDYLAAGESETSTIEYTVSDGEGGTDTASITVTVNGANDAPTTVGSLADQADQDADSVSVATAGGFTDADFSNSLTYTVADLPAGLNIDSGTGEITGTIDSSASQGGTGGVYSVTVTATDGAGATATQTFDWTVTNPAPIAQDDSNATTENAAPLNVAATGGVLSNDNDPDADDLTVSAVDGAAGNVAAGVSGDNGGIFTLQSDGSYSFDGNGDFESLAAGETAQTSAQYTVSDGEGGTDTATLTVTVTGTNDQPIAVGTIPDQSDLDADVVTVATSTAFDDVDASNTLTYDASNLPAGLSINPNTGEISGTIDNSASQGGTNGVYSITVTATDDAGTSATQTFDWTVSNPAPTATADIGSTDEDTILTVAADGVLSNDSDPDGDVLAVSAVNGDSLNVNATMAGNGSGVGNGEFIVRADGSYSFDPNGEFDYLATGESETSTISYTVSDGEGGTDTASITVTINGANDAPTPVGTLADQADVDAQDNVSVATAGSFTDADLSNTLTYSADGLPAGLSIDPNSGEITGTINSSASQDGPGDDGVHNVVITAKDDAGATTTQSFNWTVTNPAPTAQNDSNATTENATPLNVGATSGVLSNDSDPDADDLTVSEVNGVSGDVGSTVSGNNGGIFTLQADGSYSFDGNGDFESLAAGETAQTSVQYTVSDGEGGTDTATLTVTVTGTNDAPVAVGSLPDQNDIDAQAGVSVATSTGFADADSSDTLVYSAAGLPAGLSIVEATGEITGTLDSSASQGGPGDNGVHNVVITAEDDAGATTTQSFTWTVTNPAPTAVADTGSTDENNVLLVTADGVLANDNDPDGDDLTVQSVDGVDGNVGNAVAGNGSGTGNGVFIVNADGSYSFDPNGEFDYLAAGKSTTSTINYTISDGEGGTSTASITVTINGTNDAPVIDNALPNQTDVDAQDNISVATASGFSDADANDTLIYSATGLPTGLVIDSSTGEITGTIDSSASLGGPYSVTVTATDPAGESASQSFTWTVTNPTPTAQDDSNTTTENAATLTVAAADGVLSNDSDPDGDVLTVTEVNSEPSDVASAVSGNNGGTFTLQSDGSYIFNDNGDFESLAAGETAQTAVEYTVSDGEGGIDTATLTITVTGTNDAPTAVGTIPNQNDQDADSVSVATSGAFTDIDGDTLTYSADDLPTGLSIDPNSGDITGTIDSSASQGGPYSVTVTATDPTGESASQSFTWTVTNPAPVASDDAGSTDENAVLTVASANGVLANDSDPDGDTLTVQSVDGAAGNVASAVSGSNGGVFTLQSDGSYSFDGNGDFESLAAGETTQTEVQYTVSDGEGGTDTATLTVTVTGTNDAPVAVGSLPDQNDIDAQAGVSVATSTGFADADSSDTLVYSATGLPAGLSINTSTGEITGTIDNSASQGGTNGVHNVVVTVEDDAGTTTTQSFTWTVTNPAPTAVADTGSTDENSVLSVVADGVLANDSDPDGDDLTVQSVDGVDGNVGNAVAGNGSGTGNGLFTVNADGSYDFDPNGEFDYLAASESETSTINYTVSDGDGGTSTASITVTINGMNDAPVAEDDAGSTDEDTVLSVPADGALSNDSDPDGDTLTVQSVGGAAGNVANPVAGNGSGTGNGLFTVNADGSYEFDPNGEFDYLADGESETSTINYTVSDGEGGTDTASITVTINGANDAPTTVGSLPDQADQDADSVSVATAGGFTDVDLNDTLTYSVSGLPAGLSFDPNTGEITGTIDNSASQVGGGVYNITVTATDGASPVASQNFSWTITNPAPTAVPDIGSTDEDSVLDVAAADGFLNNDSDSDGDGLSVSAVNGSVLNINAAIAGTGSGSGNGVFTVRADGSYRFDPNGEFDYLADGESETSTVNYSISDGEGGIATTSITVTINGSNDQPIVQDDLSITGRNNDVTHDVLANDSDPDTSDSLRVTQVDGQNITVGGGSVTLAGGHSVILNGDGSLTVTPANDFVGQISIPYTASDNQNLGNSTSNATWVVNVIGVDIVDDASVADASTSDNVLASIDDLANAAISGQIPAGGSLQSLVITDVSSNTVVVDPNTVTINPDGSFSTTADVSGLDDGSLSVDIQAQDSASQSASSSDTILLDTVTPVAIDPLTITNGEIPGAITGTGEPDATITLTLEGNVLANNITVASDGTWSYTPTAPVALGDDTLQADAVDLWGNTNNVQRAVPTLQITDENGVDIGDLTVYEEGLANGSNPTANNEAASGSFTLTSNDALDHVQIDGTDISAAQLAAATVGSPVDINTAHGTLSVTDYNAGTGVVSYTYTLTSAAVHADGNGNNLFDEPLAIHVVDSNGDTRIDTLNVSIVDDVSTAFDNTGTTVVEGSNQLGIVAGTAHNGGVNLLDNDVQGADGAQVHSIRYNDASGTQQTATLSGNSVTVATERGGSLTVYQNGDWLYTSAAASNSNAATEHGAPTSPTDLSISDPFDYRLIDGDNDLGDWVNQPISVVDTVPVVGTADDSSVSEAHLPTGSDPTPGQLVQTGSLSVTKGADALADIDFASSTTALDALGLTSSAQPLTYAVVGDVLTASAGGNTIFTLAITNAASNTAGYEFTLVRPLDHGGAGDTINLPFSFQVTDADGDTADGSFTVAVIDDATVTNQAITLDEDGSHTFNTSADANDSNTSIGSGANAPAHGSATVNPDGSIEYTPNADYSGSDSFTYTTTVGSDTQTVTVDVTVKPVADTPELTKDAASVVTNEDTAVALGLNAPSPTDTTDQNGPAAGDNPELLGLITLGGIPNGAVLQDGTDSNAVLHNAAGGAITVFISDGSHHANVISMGADLTLTTAQFNALEVLPPANAHENFSVTASVDSFEVDATGKPLSGVASANNNTTVNVQVQAVTDDIEIKINGADSHTAFMDEDASLDIGALLNSTYMDTDGSEARSLVISGLPEDSQINGTNIDASGSITLNVPQGGLPAVSFTPPLHFSGDLEGISITLQAQDQDADGIGSGPTTGAMLSDTVELDIYVNPVADAVTLQDSITSEDTATTFLSSLAMVDPDINGGTETITDITINALADGWTISDGSGTLVFTGDGSTNYSVPPAEIANDNFRGYQLTPPAHSSVDINVSVSATTQDTQTVNGSSVTSAPLTTTVQATITVTPVAERSDTDSNGDGNNDIIIPADHAYTTQGQEDTWFNLGQEDAFDLSAGWAVEDTSETLFVLITPTLIAGDGSQANANGSQLRWDDGGTQTETFNGSPVRVPVSALDTLKFRATSQFSGQFDFNLQVQAQDYDDDTDDDTEGSGTPALDASGSMALSNVVIAPVADAVTLAVTGISRGDEDTAIPLGIRPTSSDPSESFDLTLSGIPDGSIVRYGAGNTIVYNSGETSGSVLIQDFDRSQPLSIQPPENSDADFTVNASVVSVDELDRGGGNIITSTSAPTDLDISVVVAAVADGGTVVTDEPVFAEVDLDNAGGLVDLDQLITATSLNDNDGSEAMTLRLADAPDGTTIVGASFLGGSGDTRTWLVSADEIDQVQIKLPPNYSGTFEATVTPVTTENTGDVNATGAPQDIRLTVTPSPEAGLRHVQTDLQEDTLGQVSFEIEQRDNNNNDNPDTDESLTAILINAAQVDASSDYTLYIGNSTATTLADAVASDPDVSLDAGWYRLEGAAINNVYAQGADNLHGSFGFDVRYEITDPSQDGSLAAVTNTSADTPYTLNIAAVTDAMDVEIAGFASTGNTTVSGNTVTATESTQITVSVDVSKLPDANASNQADYDGSEFVTQLLVDGVPPGISIVGADYIGSTPGQPDTGRWILNVPPPSVSMDAAQSFDVVFDLNGNTSQLSNLDVELSIEAATRDSGPNATTVRDAVTWTLQTPADFTDTNTHSNPADINQWEADTAFSAVEDTPFSLQDAINAELTGNTSDFAITLTGLPPGTEVVGMSPTVVNGELVYTASSNGGDTALQSLLNSISVTFPQDANDNNTADFSFDASLTTNIDGGTTRNSSNTTVNQPPVTPVTDEPAVLINEPVTDENTTLDFVVDLTSPIDGAAAHVVGNEVYFSLDESGMSTPGGTLTVGGSTLTLQTVSGVSGVPDGDYYIASGDIGDSLTVSYNPVQYADGTVDLSASIVSQEDGATNTRADVTSSTGVINATNSGYNASFGSGTTLSGLEDSAIAMGLSGSLNDTDGSEELLAVLVRDLPEGFVVVAGANAGAATTVDNTGDGAWSLPLSGGALPAYVGIIPPLNWSGTQPGTLAVLSGEAGLDTVQEDITPFSLEVTPVADGLTINPTATFGDEGQIIPINLNDALLDESELTTLQISGLGEYAAFHADGGLLTSQSSYDAGSDTYTLSNLTEAQLTDLGFVQAAGNYNVSVSAQSVDGTDTSAVVNGSFTASVNPQAATAGNDTLLYGGQPIDGGAGEDTIQLRLGEDLDFAGSASGQFSNIETIDLGGTDYDHQLLNLTLTDVLDMTDGDNLLQITGDSGDRVDLLDDLPGDWNAAGSAGGFDSYTGTIGTETVTVEIQSGIVVD